MLCIFITKSKNNSISKQLNDEYFCLNIMLRGNYYLGVPILNHL